MKPYRAFMPVWNGLCKTPNYTEACKILEDYYPDNGSSPRCPAKSLPEIEYDLLIVVAAYNVAPYIEECIDSILTQETNYKILIRIVNDASTDNTALVIKKYESIPGVEIITHAENRGLSGARNSALQNLNATFICNVDADDKLKPGALNHWLDVAYSRNADIVSVGLSRFDSTTGEILYTLNPQQSDTNKGMDINDIEGQPTVFLYHRKFFRNVVYPLNYWYEDIIFELLFFPKAENIVAAPGAYYLYRFREDSITQSHSSPRNLCSLYCGAKSILGSIETGCWSGDFNKKYLSSLCAHIIRITYQRMIMQSTIIRKSTMVYWKPIVERFIELVDEPLDSDKQLFESILAGDYPSYELNCIKFRN